MASSGKTLAEQRAWHDRRLLETFNCLGAKLTKTGRFYRLELTRNWQDELCKAVYQREQFLKLIRTGVLIVTEEGESVA